MSWSDAGIAGGMKSTSLSKTEQTTADITHHTARCSGTALSPIVTALTERGEKMSCSLWRWSERCEGKPCCGDCDECGEEDDD